MKKKRKPLPQAPANSIPSRARVSKCDFGGTQSIELLPVTFHPLSEEAKFK
jgi:hypothetical protein